MKILQLIFNLRSGGAEKFTVDLSNELSNSNEVYLCMVQSDNDEQLSFFKQQLDEKVNYINLGCSKGINLKTFLKIFGLINEIKPDVVHGHLNVILYLYLPSFFLKNKIKFVHTLHSLAPKSVGFTSQKKLNNFFYKRNFINAVAISKQCETSFFEFYGHKNISLVVNGISKPGKTKKYDEVKTELNNLKFGSTDKIVIHVATFSEQKNQNILVEVFNRIITENRGVILVVIGHNFDSPEAKKLRDMSKPGINYLGTRTNISDYYLNSDVFVLSSLREGLPISLLEAISCGVIPVCTPAGGIPDVIKDETLGFVSMDFSEISFYEAVVECLNNIDQFDRLNLEKYYKLNFSMERCARDYEAIYNSEVDPIVDTILS